MTESGNGNKCFMFTLWRCAEWQLCKWMCLLWNYVAFAPTPAFHFLSNVLRVVLQVWFLLQWKRAWPGLPHRISVPVAHPVSKYSLWTDWEEKGLIVSPQLWMVTGLRLLLLWFHRDTLEQIVSALMDSTVELELFLSTVEISISLHLAWIRWCHIRIYLLKFGTSQMCVKTVVHLLARAGNPYRQARPADEQNLTQ